MRTWRRAKKGERCGFCVDHVFKGGEPIMELGPLKRCASCAKARYGEDVPVPFPEDEITVATSDRKPDFVTAGELARSSRYRGPDLKLRQTGERVE